MLNKHNPFNFDNACFLSFEGLKEKLKNAPIITVHDWTLDFELMCDTSDYAVGGVLGKRKNKKFHSIHYASKVFNEAQVN